MSRKAIQEIVEGALAEDIGKSLDLTEDYSSQLLPEGMQGKGIIQCNEPGVLAGTGPAELTFQLISPDTSINWLFHNGDEISAKSPVCEVEGQLAHILTAERTALNFLSHLSGIATLTRRFVEAVKPMDTVKSLDKCQTEIYDTRKTTPGLRALEKAAVVAGGGRNHRFGLNDAILIKDNHLVCISIAEAVKNSREKHPDLFIEVECETIEQVSEAVSVGADAVLLDNMSADEIRSCIQLVDESAEKTGKRCLTEASGGINLENILSIAHTGVNRISTGVITKSAPALDFSMDISNGSKEK